MGTTLGILIKLISVQGIEFPSVKIGKQFFVHIALNCISSLLQDDKIGEPAVGFGYWGNEQFVRREIVLHACIHKGNVVRDRICV